MPTEDAEVERQVHAAEAGVCFFPSDDAHVQGGRLGAVCDSELPEDRREMELHGVRRDVELRRRLGVRAPASDPLEHLVLTWREAVERTEIGGAFGRDGHGMIVRPRTTIATRRSTSKPASQTARDGTRQVDRQPLTTLRTAELTASTSASLSSGYRGKLTTSREAASLTGREPSLERCT